MSDSDNYFSDTDNEENQEEETNTPNSDEDQLEEYEMDEETRRIVFSHLKSSENLDDYFTRNDQVPIKKSKRKKKQNKDRKKNSLSEFIRLEEEKAEANKPKKWSSKRFNDKKNKLGISKEKVIKRKFNPRLPPPNHLTFKKKEIEKASDINDKQSFPSLFDKDSSSNKNVNV